MYFHVFVPHHAPAEEWIPEEFWGRKEELPPLKTETVEPVASLVHEESQR